MSIHKVVHRAVLFLLGLCVAMLFFALAPFVRDHLVRLLLLCGSILGMAGLAVFEKTYQKKYVFPEQERQAAVRLKDLTAQAQGDGFALAIHASQIPPLLAGLFLMGMFAFLLILPSIPLLFKVLCILLLGLVGLLIVKAVQLMGKPTLLLTKEGFSTPLLGQIPWYAVFGIYRKKLSSLYVNAGYHMVFRVPQIDLYIGQFTWSERLLRPLLNWNPKDRIFVQIRKGSEPPEVVAGIARLLWTLSTGRDYDWDPDLADIANEAQKRLSELSDRDRNSGLATSDREVVAKALRTKKLKRSLAIVFAILLYLVLKIFLH